MGGPKRRSPEHREEGRRIARGLAVTFQALGCAAASGALPLALSGDAAAAAELVATAPPDLRGLCAVALHLHNVPPAVMRQTLEAMAFADPAGLLAAATHVDRIGAMCRHAEVAAPTELPETFQAWRGVRGQGVKRGAKGLVWTLDRAAACWDATCDNAEGMYPLLLTATARRQNVGLRAGDSLLILRVENPHVDREPGGIEAWRKIGAAHRLVALEAERARRGLATMEASTWMSGNTQRPPAPY